MDRKTYHVQRRETRRRVFVQKTILAAWGWSAKKVWGSLGRIGGGFAGSISGRKTTDRLEAIGKLRADGEKRGVRKWGKREAFGKVPSKQGAGSDKKTEERRTTGGQNHQGARGVQLHGRGCPWQRRKENPPDSYIKKKEI